MFSLEFYIYILFSESSNKFYIGYSSDPWERLNEHNTSLHSTYTSKHRPWEICAIFLVGFYENEAIKIERFLKKQHSVSLIKKLIDPSFKLKGSLAQLVRVPHVRDASRDMRD